MLIGNMNKRIVADAKARASAEEAAEKAEEAERKERYEKLTASMEARAKEENEAYRLKQEGKKSRMSAAVKAAASRKAGTLQGK